MLDSMPLWFTKFTSPEAYLVLRQSYVLLQQTLAIAKQRGNTDYKDTTGRPSMLEMFLSSGLPPSEKKPERIRVKRLLPLEPAL